MTGSPPFWSERRSKMPVPINGIVYHETFAT
jgi:hypothetical protein